MTNQAVQAVDTRRSIVGRVVSNKMEKTIVVELQRRITHKKYGKFIKRSTKFYAHDESNVAQIGDLVRLVVSRPLSKTKNWLLAEVVQKASEV